MCMSLCIQESNGRVNKAGIISARKLADKLFTPLYYYLLYSPSSGCCALPLLSTSLSIPGMAEMVIIAESQTLKLYGKT